MQTYDDFQDNRWAGMTQNNLSNTHCHDDSEIMISTIIRNTLSLIEIMALQPPQPLVGKDNDYLGCHICSKRRLTVMVVSCFACFVSCLDQVSLVIALTTHIRALLWCHLSSQTAGCVFVLESGLLLSAYDLDLEMPDSLTTSRPPHL